MGFAALDTDQGLASLNSFLEDKSYIEGQAHFLIFSFQASQADTVVFNALKEAPNSQKYVHAARWYKHISSFGAKKDSFPGQKKSLDQYGPSAAAAAAKKEEDEIDLFGSDDEEDAEAERLKALRLEEYNKKKAAKPAVIAKSSVILDIKPWDDTTDLVEMEKCIRSIELDGLLWGASKLVAVGYGIKKLQITCVVEDDKVGTDLLEEKITEFEDLVQSMDVVSFNKI